MTWEMDLPFHHTRMEALMNPLHYRILGRTVLEDENCGQIGRRSVPASLGQTARATGEAALVTTQDMTTLTPLLLRTIVDVRKHSYCHASVLTTCSCSKKAS